MAYSETLASGLERIIVNAKTIFEICNGTRADLELIFTQGTHWRDYPNEVLRLFETINAIERNALWLIEDTDDIRYKNEKLRVG